MVGWLDIFRRRKGDAPLERYEDKELGPMLWSEDDDGWAGEHNGVRFLIAYGSQSTPTNDLLDYAREMLADPGKLLGTVDRAKPAAIVENPRLADEITGLRIEAVHFYTHATVRRIIADLSGGTRDRSWRVEFKEEDCEGIGFDT